MQDIHIAGEGIYQGKVNTIMSSCRFEQKSVKHFNQVEPIAALPRTIGQISFPS